MAASPDLPSLDDVNPAPPSEREGFAISLPSAQLADLIQINCINRVRGAFRVSSKGREGHLFFDAGQLVHAELENVSGLDAIVQMLGWRGGSIQPCVAPWPAVSTIDMGADALLLCAAHRLDEQPLRHSEAPQELTTKVIRRVTMAEEAETRESSAPEHAPRGGGASRNIAGRGLPSSAQLSQLQVAQVRFDGSIAQLKGGASIDLADTAFFSERMGAQIGEALGLGSCRALFLEGENDGVVVLKGRSIVATRGKTAELGFALERLRLM